jgi:penicillin-binding protein 1C
MSQVAVCAQSGQRATSLCEKSDTVWIAQAGLQTLPCAYHKKIFLSTDKKFRVHASCESISKMIEVDWFVLPPIQEFYFKGKNFSYHTLPPWRKGCTDTNSVATMDLIYPKANSKVYVPYDLDGSSGSALFEAAHSNPSATIFWHIDGKFLATTQKSHKLPVHPDPGNHTLLLVDDAGESISRPFSVISVKK